ncbi:MAG: ABC transporter ATP-binding protein [Deltaproteobacteria bacterium]|nr:ABC transporter ATP-binding protein [Deltaproteobacteria bacterium]
MLKVSNLQVNYGSVTAVQNLSLEVGEGEIVALVGANGAGKTSTLMSISGVVRASGGQIEFDGRSLRRLTPFQIVSAGISLVPEGRRILAGLTVKENLLLGTTVRKDKLQAQKDIDKMLDRFPILRERYEGLAGSLSGGEQQMLAFARALLSRPRLLLCDETSLGLSPMMTDLVFQILEELHAEGLTLLIVEQMATRAIAMADRTYVIKKGAIALSGSREEMMSHEDLQQAYFGLKQT